MEVTVDATSASAGGEVAGQVFSEISRLQSVFDWFDPTSELWRHHRGEVDAGPELEAVLALAEAWRARTGGAFDAAVGSLVSLWNEAAGRGTRPTDLELARAVVTMSHRDPDAPPASLNAIAKGWIVDRAAHLGSGNSAVTSLLVNAGGDLVHIGPSPILVGIEDPRRPYDNAPPLLRVFLRGAALATSGNARRGWTIGGQKYGHVIDPRSGWPTGHIASASVIAEDAATSDALATALMVCTPEQGLELCRVMNVAGCIIDTHHDIHRNAKWRRHELTRSPESAPTTTLGPRYAAR